jgi:hypothetical protein
MKNKENLFQNRIGILENIKSLYSKGVNRLDKLFSVFNSKDFQLIQGKKDQLLSIFETKIGHIN